MRIVVAGGSGLIGTALRERLAGAGHEVVRLVRSPGGDAGAEPHGATAPWDPAAGHLDRSVIEGADAVVNLSGAGIGDRRWSESYRRELAASRTGPTSLLARTIAAADRRPEVFVSASGTGWYGARGDELLDESSTPGEGFLADLCRRWEAATLPAQEAGVRTVHIRTGIVMSARGGALRKQLPLFKLGLGGRFGSGRQWQSWISIDDEVGAIEHLLTSTLSGPVNLTAPNPVTNREFTRVLASVLRRPALLAIPGFAPKLVLGSDLVEELLLTGQRVQPSALTADGYTFRHPTLRVALEALLRP